MTNKPLPVPLNMPRQPYLIERAVNGDVVHQRPRDGFVNATELCAKSGKRFNNYHQTAQTQAFYGRYP